MIFTIGKIFLKEKIFLAVSLCVEQWAGVSVRCVCVRCNLIYLQRRRGSKDAAGDEKSEWERRLDKPSVPLKAIGEPGPPRIVEIQEKYGAVEGEH